VATPLSITIGTGMPDDQIPPGNYPASLVSVTERTIEVKGESRDVYEWTFAVPTQEDDGSPGEPIKVSGLSSQMTGPKSKTAAFLVALLGPSAVQPGATFTMNDLIGKECLIQTELNDSGYAKVVGATPLPVQSAPRPSNRAAAGVDEAETKDDKPKKAAAVMPAAAPVIAAQGTDDDDLPF
jgi:hypothetical protein